MGSNNGKVAAYEWRNNALSIKSGWPASACDAGQCPEVRGLAAGDLDNNGTIEIVATTTQNQGGAQVFVYNYDGSLYQPAGLSFNAWPRYNTDTGEGGDADDNGAGNHGYGCYGLNVGVGNLDDDAFQEIVVTFDNHQINVFQHTGESMLASSYFTNRSSQYSGFPLNWGQFIRYFDPQVEEDHYHLHIGDWPGPSTRKWMQWTQSPPCVTDLNLDGKNEVVCVSNVEKDEPYDTKHHSIMALEGSYGDGERSARRLAGWENLPSSGYPLSRVLSWYPPSNPPAPTIVDILGDSRPEILYAAHDGRVYCTSPTATQLWSLDIRHGRALMYASEIMVADLNQDNIPELILTTYGNPESVTPGQAHGYLMILDRDGNVLHDIELPQQGTNGNGKGAPAAPTVMDLNEDGTLEIVVQTFGAGCFVYTVPGSAENLLLWPTGRGNYLRDGAPWMTITSPPGQVPLQAPSGVINTKTPTYTWSPVAGATWYYLWVKSSTANPAFAKWYRSQDIVSGGVCAVTPDAPLGEGAHRWWIQTWNSNGYGPWSAAMNFTVNTAPPAAATLLEPSGTTSDTTPTYTWNPVAGATWYYFWLRSPSANPAFKQWYRAGDVINNGVCSITPNFQLGQDAHRWWIQTWNSNGYGPWSAAMNFTVNTAPPAAATLLGPSGTISDATPTYTWNAVEGATWYYFWLASPSATPALKQWYRAEDVVNNGVCSITPNLQLGQGAHRWWIQTWNSNGYGPWSAAMSFTRE